MKGILNGSGQIRRTFANTSSVAKVIAVVLLIGAVNCAYGIDQIAQPPFVNKVNSSAVQEAGQEVNGWVVATLSVLIAVCASIPAFHFVTGNAQKGWDYSKNVLLGGAVAALLGSVVFGVISALT